METTTALFYIDWKRLQLNQPVPFSGGTIFYFQRRGRREQGCGVRPEVSSGGALGFIGSVGYTDAKFRSGSTAFNANAGVNQNVGGNRLPFTPSFTGNMERKCHGLRAGRRRFMRGRSLQFMGILFMTPPMRKANPHTA